MAETRPVRIGEELDVNGLRQFLGLNPGLSNAEIGIEQFPAGSSNLTYLITIGEKEYVLRRPPFGNRVKTAHDMRREFDVLSKLSSVYPPAPKPLIFCDDGEVIGSDFYLMERRHGLIIRGDLQKDSVENYFKICRSFIKTLADLHSLDPQTAGLTELGHPDGYIRRQVEGWAKRYFAAKTHDHPELEDVVEWLNDNIPVEHGAAIIHNDYKFDNVMLATDDLAKITAVLDWEMVTIGDPLMDLGTTLGYWMSRDAGEDLMSMPFNPRILMENISRRELVEMYSDSTGRKLPDMLFYYIFGTFKIAVIAQQIYARYVKGFTRDERFARFDRSVAALGKIANSSLERGTI